MLLNPFAPSAPFLYPLKKPSGFIMFSGIEKRCIGNKWLKRCWPCTLEIKIMKLAFYAVLEIKKKIGCFTTRLFFARKFSKFFKTVVLWKVNSYQLKMSFNKKF